MELNKKYVDNYVHVYFPIFKPHFIIIPFLFIFSRDMVRVRNLDILIWNKKVRLVN